MFNLLRTLCATGQILEKNWFSGLSAWLERKSSKIGFHVAQALMGHGVKWSVARGAVCRVVSAELTLDSIFSPRLKFEQSWKQIESFITQVIRTEDMDGRRG